MKVFDFMTYARISDLELWEIGLNDLFFDFYKILYNPISDRSSCFEAAYEFRGYYTALFYSNIITKSEKELLFHELQTMTDLIFANKFGF